MSVCGETFHLDRLGTKWHPRDLVIQSNFTWSTVISLHCHWDISLHTCNQPLVFRALKTELTIWKDEMESPTLFCRLYSHFLLCSPNCTYNTASKRKLKLKKQTNIFPWIFLFWPHFYLALLLTMCLDRRLRRLNLCGGSSVRNVCS